LYRLSIFYSKIVSFYKNYYLLILQNIICTFCNRSSLFILKCDVRQGLSTTLPHEEDLSILYFLILYCFPISALSFLYNRELQYVSSLSVNFRLTSESLLICRPLYRIGYFHFIKQVYPSYYQHNQSIFYSISNL